MLIELHKKFDSEEEKPRCYDVSNFQNLEECKQQCKEDLSKTAKPEGNNFK